MLKQYFERKELESALKRELPVTCGSIIEYDESHDDEDDNDCMYYEQNRNNDVVNVMISENLNNLHKCELLTLLESFQINLGIPI
jgi:hypothetical protein